MSFATTTKSFGMIAQKGTGRSLRQRIRAVFVTAQERRQLRDIDARQLRDLGISAGDAAKEAARPAWDLPKRFR